MPLDYSIDKSSGMLRMMGQGTILVGDIEACFQRVLADPDYCGVDRELGDFRDATFSLNPEDVNRLAQITRKRSPEHQIQRRAIVVASELHYGLARMFSQLVAPSGQEVRPFRDIDEAQRWLDGDLAGEGT